VLRCRAFHEERIVMFCRGTKLRRAFRVLKWFALINVERHMDTLDRQIDR
jgi:hypothetical protein